MLRSNADDSVWLYITVKELTSPGTY